MQEGARGERAYACTDGKAEPAKKPYREKHMWGVGAPMANALKDTLHGPCFMWRQYRQYNLSYLCKDEPQDLRGRDLADDCPKRDHARASAEGGVDEQR